MLRDDCTALDPRGQCACLPRIRISCLVPAACLQLKNRPDITACFPSTCTAQAFSWTRRDCDMPVDCTLSGAAAQIGTRAWDDLSPAFRLSTPCPAQSTPRSLRQWLLCHAR